jgi:glutamyl-tRNA reductase
MPSARPAAAHASAPTELLYAGLSHRRAPIALRERFARLAVDAGAVAALLVERLGAREALVVVTPGHVEAYLVAPAGDAIAAALVQRAARRAGVGEAELARLLELRRGARARRRLVELAAGLDAPLLGATEVPELIREAHVAATRAGAGGPALDRLVGRALAVARLVRAEARLGAGRAGLTGVAAELARRHPGDRAAGRALVLGATPTARIVAARLHTVGWPTLQLGEEQPARLAALLPCYDVVVTAAGVPRLLGRDAVAGALAERRAERRAQALLVVDLSLPRDVDPAVRHLDGVELHDLDDLGSFGTRIAPEPAATVAAARALVGRELARLERWPAPTAAGDRVIAQSA